LIHGVSSSKPYPYLEGNSPLRLVRRVDSRRFDVLCVAKGLRSKNSSFRWILRVGRSAKALRHWDRILGIGARSASDAVLEAGRGCAGRLADHRHAESHAEDALEHAGRLSGAVARRAKNERNARPAWVKFNDLVGVYIKSDGH
jgi:hypothetical protein